MLEVSELLIPGAMGDGCEVKELRMAIACSLSSSVLYSTARQFRSQSRSILKSEITKHS